ncbi:amidase signature enzyme [Mycena metata]|uniref:Amidase signature enzyme n=1 Tax=Mycena metata TaxID=1033252 RepID=A0AAD7H859_9AGAR|nr:amidase signature enzyme [Mycena metata]
MGSSASALIFLSSHDPWCRVRLRPFGDGFCSRGRENPTCTTSGSPSTWKNTCISVVCTASIFHYTTVHIRHPSGGVSHSTLLNSASRWFALALALFSAHASLSLSGRVFLPLSNIFRAGRPPSPPALYEASVHELQAGLDGGQFTSVDLVKAYFARIEEVNIEGPGLRAVLELNPSALEQAALLDAERKLAGKRSQLHGIPILLKDNIATIASEGNCVREDLPGLTELLGMNTTAGSFSLLGSVVPEDAGVVKRLRKAGAIILGKANLSEFSRFRGRLASGWSGRGGQASNAYFPHTDPCGSSSGSGIAASIGLVAVTLGTETSGSITCPASRNNIAGIKPTLGLTSRAGVIPISVHQDTVGPMARSITDAAIVLSIIAGKDPNDNYTFAQPPVVPDYTKALNRNALEGKRIGVPRRVFLNDSITKNHPSINVEFEKALLTIKALGATVVDPADLPSAEEFVTSENDTMVFHVDFKIQINEYLKGLLKNPSGVRSLANLITFNNDNPELEQPAGFEDQSEFITSEATDGYNAAYFAALAADHDLGSTRGIDFVLKKFNLDALVLPASGFTPRPAAVVGYPIVTVPLGFFPDDVTIGPAGPATVYPAPGVPFGLSFFGTAFSDFELVGFGFAYEQKTQTRLARKAFPAAIPKTQLKDVIGK